MRIGRVLGEVAPVNQLATVILEMRVVSAASRSLDVARDILKLASREQRHRSQTRLRIAFLMLVVQRSNTRNELRAKLKLKFIGRSVEMSYPGCTDAEFWMLNEHTRMVV